MAPEGELVTGSEVRAIAGTLDLEAQTLLLLHADPDGPLLVLEYLLELLGSLGAGLVDPVEALGVAAGIVVDLEVLVVGDGESVAHLADRDAVADHHLR